MRDDTAADADLPRRIAGCRRNALSAAASTSAAASAAADGVPERNDGTRRNDLPDAAASAASAAASEPRRRARLTARAGNRRYDRGAGVYLRRDHSPFENAD
jgi:hypothetical protein